MMGDIELSYALIDAYRAGDKEKFIELCCDSEVYEDVYKRGYFYSLAIVQSIIAVPNYQFVRTLRQFIKPNEKAEFEKLEAQEGHYTEIFEELAYKFKNKYEKNLDGVFIWENAEKIIKDLQYYLLTTNAINNKIKLEALEHWQGCFYNDIY
jgi:hypothetical protein|nr:MAG TPA: hypothetical protein [Caudoviricetes sp.]